MINRCNNKKTPEGLNKAKKKDKKAIF